MDFKKIAGLIMIEQTLFALPFAWIGMLFAGGGTPVQWCWATLALVAARTAGMSFNRVLDAKIDAANPRTSSRHIPAGLLSKLSVWALAGASSAVLVGASYMLNPLCFYLSFAAVAMLATYSLFKRFSASSHYYLGLVEAAAPVGGYLAVTGAFDLVAFIPGAAIMLWIAGLDILYAIQVIEFDTTSGLHSIPALIGPSLAKSLSAYSYILALAALFAGGRMMGAGWCYWASLATVAMIFLEQLTIAREADDMGGAILRIFALNRFVSPVLFGGMLCDRLAALVK